MHDDRDGRVRLDIEDEDERFQRIQMTLEKLNATSSPSTSVPSSTPNFSFLNTDSRRSKPCYIPPPTELLSRVTAFLPALEASNTLLEQRVHQDPKSVDIEHIDEGMGQYIEMNLGLGVFETRPTSHSKDATMTSCSPSSSASSSSTSSSATSDSDASYDSDSESDAEIITSFNPIRPIKPLPRRSWANRRPQIVMLNQSQGEASDHGMCEGEAG